MKPKLVGVVLVLVAAACSSTRYQEDPARKEPWRELEIAVVSSGTPVAGARVHLSWPDPTDHFRSSLHDGHVHGELETNAFGIARADVQSTAVKVDVSKRGLLGTTTEAHIEGTKARVEVSLEPATEVTGRVVDAEGRPLDQVLVHIEGAETTEEFRTAADGRFSFQTLKPGKKYRLSVAFLPRRLWLPPDPREVDVPALGVEFKVTKRAGAVRIDFAAPAGADLGDHPHANLEVLEGGKWVESPSNLYFWPPGAPGSEVYGQLPPGKYRVKPVVDGFDGDVSGEFDVTAGEEARVRVDLRSK